MSKNPKDRDDRNKGRNDNYDRRIIVDPPSDEQKKQPEEAVSSRRKGFYIILLLGITAIGIYVVLNSLLPHTTAKKPNETKTGSAYSTAAPNYDSVPANAQTTPYDASEPLSRNEINSQTQKATEKPDAETTSDSEAAELVQPPVSGKIIKDFSDSELLYSDTMKDWRTHAGVDIAANKDTPVTAIKDGVLKKVYEDSLFGTTVILHHDDSGIDSVYCNLKDATSEPIGAAIKMGDVLGKVGSSAVSEVNDQPHLHFEIKLDDNFLDPKQFVKFEEVDYVQPEPSASASASAATSSSAAPTTSNSSVPTTSNPGTASPAKSSPEVSGDDYDYGDEDAETMIID